MATITSLGVGSGLPLQDTLDKLSDVEKQRLKPISNQQTAASNKQKAYQQLKTSLAEFQEANSILNNVDLYSSTKAISNSTDITVSTTANVPAGKYQIKVEHLATTQTLSTSAQTGKSDTERGSSAQTRTLTLTKNDSKASSVVISLSKEQTSLEGIRDAINNANAGISASLLKVQEDSYQLFISSAMTGTDNALKSISVTGDDSLAAILAYDSTDSSGTAASRHMQQRVAAQNLIFTINDNGENIERQSNTVTDAIQGMTLNISKPGEAIISVDTNTDAVKSAVKGWVNAYNSLLKTVGDLSFYSPVDPGAKNQNSSNGPLVGDPVIINLKSRIRDQFISATGQPNYNALSDIGIKTTDFTTGQVTLDEKKLDKALLQYPAEVRDLLVGKDTSNNSGKSNHSVVIKDGSNHNGVIGRVDKLLNDYLSSTGVIKTMEDGLSKKLIDLKKQYDRVNDSINDRINAYKIQFTQLDIMVKKMDSLSKQLMQQFDALKKSTDQ